ncbi:rRNA methyltransferase [Dictyobacter vulcani]|uniref:rRNA methyltransferase n=1 Tax=Dictyobacter vulcani TaxID=2607529 RepID=A0A5J4KPD4_9CHLR|nr:RNA methyltransferase [Dictyobacter vulcani]GER89022.1 rRNA methyltransferase [Dictyobacter vulcani]
MAKQHHSQTERHQSFSVFSDTIITNRNNPKIKQIRALLKRSERERTGLALVEGLRLVTEALRSPQRVRQLLIAPELLRSRHGQALLQEHRQKGLPCLYVSSEVFQSFSLKDNPQGIAAVVSQQWEQLEQVRLSPEEFWVALEAVQDPGNLGTILRTCDATGCRGVFLLDHTTDAYDPTALRASMGAIFSQRLVKTSFQAFANWKRLYHYPVVGASDAAVVNYRQADYPLPMILLMGSERQGLSSEQQTLCDFIVGIPMRGSSDSLNVSIATAVVLYEILHHRG